MVDSTDNENFSPFDQPKKEARVPGMTDNTGMKIEHINDDHIDGPKPGGAAPATPFDDGPKDAPVFTVPNFDQVPNAEIPPSTGGGNSGGGGGSSTSGSGTKMDPEFTKGLSEFTAKWLVDMYFKLLIMGLVSYAKINKTEVMAGVKEGYIEEKFVKYVEQCNKNVESGITVTDEEKNFIVEPLKYFLEVKKVNIKPEYMFLGGLVMVSGQVFFRANEIKKQNKEILDRIIAESAAIRNSGRSRASNDAPEQRESFNGPTFSVQNDRAEETVTSYGPNDVEELNPDNHN